MERERERETEMDFKVLETKRIPLTNCRKIPIIYEVFKSPSLSLSQPSGYIDTITHVHKSITVGQKKDTAVNNINLCALGYRRPMLFTDINKP